jgi:1,4-alpha-glucan branching enzyme
MRDLNRVYRSVPALHELDCDAEGFEWLVANDADRSVFAWLRKGRDARARCLVAVNFTPEAQRGYRIKVPLSGTWREILNTDAALYGGGNVGNDGVVTTIDGSQVSEVELVIPPLAAIYLVPG